MNFFLQKLFSSLTWRLPTDKKTLYLTFDDGPIPEVTPWVLKLLKEYNASATFFCVGDNSKKYPDVMHQILDAKHSIGNHTMHHLNGWKTPIKNYVLDVEECRKYVRSILFRPPYGRIKYSQIRALKKDFKIIMWDVLSKDYDVSLSGEQCFENVKRKATNGSIIVFHDSLKAEMRLRIALPATLDFFSKQGYTFASIQLAD